MNNSYRKLLFENAFDYIRRKSNILLTWPRWTITDIHDFWNDKWEGEENINPEPPDRPHSSDRD